MKQDARYRIYLHNTSLKLDFTIFYCTLLQLDWYKMYQAAHLYEDCVNLNEIENHLKYLYYIREKSIDKIIRLIQHSNRLVYNSYILGKQTVKGHVHTFNMYNHR